MERSYYEEKFIREGAFKLEMEANKRHLEAVRVFLGESAYEEELLSETPIYLKGVVVRDPRGGFLYR